MSRKTGNDRRILVALIAVFVAEFVACNAQFADPILLPSGGGGGSTGGGGMAIPDAGAQNDGPVSPIDVTDGGGPVVDASGMDAQDADSGAIVDAVAEDVGADPCAQWQTAAECRADTTHGCNEEPNPVGCHASDSSCPIGVCRAGDPYVRRSGETLWLHGAQYSFVGAVSWAAAGAPPSAACFVATYPTQDAALARTFDDLVDMKANVLRVWAFQSYAGSTGTDYTSIDRVVTYARRAGVRLILVLENMWNDSCTQGGQRTTAWFAGGYAAPYGNYALSLPDYVRGLVAHYRDEPTILAWQVMNEAGADSFDAMDSFGRTMTQLIRNADPNHLIALGVNNGYSPGTSNSGDPSNYQKLQDYAEIDLIGVSDFDTTDGLTADMIRDQAIAHALKKPVFVGASAVKLLDTTKAAYDARATVIAKKLQAALSGGFAGYLVYDYSPAWSSLTWDFDGRPEEPLAGPTGIIARRGQ